MHKIKVLQSSTAILITAVGVVCMSFAAEAADPSRPRGSRDYEVYGSQPNLQQNFYVRGDLGVARNSVGSLSQQDLADNGGTFLMQSMDDTITVGAGFGWQVNPRFRVDLTGEYRSTAGLKALDDLQATLVAPPGTLQANTLYQGNISSYVGMLNGYWDLFSARGFTPYLGAGIGFAHNRSTGFTTVSTATFTDAVTGAQTVELTNGTSQTVGQTNLAWALMAGTSFDLAPNAKLDIGYRYLNLGSGISATTGLLDCVCGTVGQPLKLADLDAHELRIGVRWLLGAETSRAHQPLR
jgi:opacity protein-like surface antigen